MTTISNLRKLLHRKAWEMCAPLPLNTTAAGFAVSDKDNLTSKSPAFYVASTTVIYRYEGEEDGWVQIPSSGVTGTFGAGACGEFRGLGAMGGSFTQTATGGTTVTLVTNRTVVRNLTGRKIRVVAGTGIGYEGAIASNTLGANAVLTVSTPNGVAFDATTQFQVYSGSLWFFCPGAGTVGFSVYDIATNAWTARSVTGVATTFGTDGMLVSTPSGAMTAITGTSTGSNTSTTLNNSGKSWGTNMWANYQIRITVGTGIGQIRTIASNTGTAITVSSAWTITPDATSVYSIEPNDDFFYLMGNNVVTMYRYSVSGNSWSTLSPTAARAGAPGAGAAASFIGGASGWNNETLLNHLQAATLFRQNGRYVYSFRGGNSNVLDVYDIAGNTWISGLAYSNQTETFTTGCGYCDSDGKIFISKEASGRIMIFDVVENILLGSTPNYHPQGTVILGNKLFCLPYSDGGTKLLFLYSLQHTRSELVRSLII